MATTTLGHTVHIGEPPISRFLFADTRLAAVWLVIRLYTGYEWLMAGYNKLVSPAWVGDKAGSAITGFATGALGKSTTAHPDVTGWYAAFLQSVVLPNAPVWSWAITLGEVAVGIGLILGLFTGIAAFFGGMMNANYLLAGTLSTNPLLFILSTWLVLAWRVAGYYGVDRWLLPALGVPGEPGSVFQHEKPLVVVSAAGSPSAATPFPLS
jgi:thiosulfate dehydrogenase [quinone] large subunit